MAKDTMTSRERVNCALAHKEADRIPLDLNGTGSTGILPEAYQQLRDYMKLEKKPTKIWHVMQQLAEVDEDLLCRLGVDVRRVDPGNPSNWTLKIEEQDGYNTYTDEWGIGFRMPIEGGFYYDMYKFPLSGAETIADIESYDWPDPTDPARFESMAESALAQHESTGAAITAGVMCPGALDMACWMMGHEQCMMTIACNMKLVEALMEKVTELKCQFWETALPLIESKVDVVMECDDLGGQFGPLINPKIYRQYIKPLHKRLCDVIRKYTQKPIYFHACGSVKEFLPDLIECGINCLNPVQVSAADMDTKDLKKEFGKDITFWGGGCESQKILWSGTRQEVRDEVKKRIEDLAPGGGFVFSQVHNIQNGVPPQNLVAMWEAFAEYGQY